MKKDAAPVAARRLQAAHSLAQDVLGNPAAADAWLRSEAYGLEWRRPMDLLATAEGTDAVMTLLRRMQHGVYA